MDNSNNRNRNDFFQKYTQYLNQEYTPKVTKWNEYRTTQESNYSNEKKIATQELKQIDFNHPLDSIDEKYQKEEYCSSILLAELDAILQDYNYDNTLIIGKTVDKCEKLERIKNLIDYLLKFILENNLNMISNNYIK